MGGVVYVCSWPWWECYHYLLSAQILHFTAVDGAAHHVQDIFSRCNYLIPKKKPAKGIQRFIFSIPMYVGIHMCVQVTTEAWGV